MCRYVIWLAFAGQFLSIVSSAHEIISKSNCGSYLQIDATGNSVGILRVESLLGHQTTILDVSQAINESRAKTDPQLRVVNLGDLFSDGPLFMGFGRPNVFLGIPNVTPEEGLGYAKVDAKSLKRGDTQVVDTHDRVQSGLLLVFKGLAPRVTENVLAVARRHVGTRQMTCVNANCRILSEAGFTLGGESLDQYYFPVKLLSDILRYGLEYQGRPVEFEIVKTTPGYLEEVGLSINHAVWSTLCRHAEKSCNSLTARLKRNTYVIGFNEGLKRHLGLAIINDENIGPIEKPMWETQVTRAQIPEELQRPYNLEVSEPSQLGHLMRLLWGPHSLFEVSLPEGVVDQYLPGKLVPFPHVDPPLSTRFKKHLLFSPAVVNLLKGLISKSYKRVSGITHDLLFDMIRTSSDKYPNKYNFVLTGDRLIIMKLDIKNSLIDWIMAKHVLMAGYSKDVRLSGEMWKVSGNEIPYNLDSGTFMPGEDLPAPSQALLEYLFPGIKFTPQKRLPK